MNWSDFLKENKIEGNPEVMVATSNCSSIAEEFPVVKMIPKYKLSDAVSTVDEGLTLVAVICDQNFTPQYDDVTEDQFREEMAEF